MERISRMNKVTNEKVLGKVGEKRAMVEQL